MLEKLEAKLGAMLEGVENQPVESLLKIVVLYVVFKQLFKNK